MKRSSHAPSKASEASGALHVAHAGQHGSVRPIAKAHGARPTRVQAHERLAFDLKRAGVSDDKAAKATGYSRSTIARYRKGEQRIDPNVLLWAMALPDKELTAARTDVPQQTSGQVPQDSGEIAHVDSGSNQRRGLAAAESRVGNPGVGANPTGETSSRRVA